MADIERGVLNGAAMGVALKMMHRIIPQKDFGLVSYRRFYFGE